MWVYVFLNEKSFEMQNIREYQSLKKGGGGLCRCWISHRWNTWDSEWETKEIKQRSDRVHGVRECLLSEIEIQGLRMVLMRMISLSASLRLHGEDREGSYKLLRFLYIAENVIKSPVKHVIKLFVICMQSTKVLLKKTCYIGTINGNKFAKEVHLFIIIFMPIK